MGNIVTIYNSCINRSGSTTVAIAIAAVMSRLALKRTLLINYAEDKKMEEYLSDIKGIKGIEYIDLFQDVLDEEKLNMITTSIDNKLDIIGGSNNEFVDNMSLSESICKYIEVAKEKYDFIIIDLSNRKDLDILDKSDVVIPVLPFDGHMFDMARDLKEYDNQITVVNNVHPNLKREVPDFKTRTLAVSTDINVVYQATKERNIYPYLVDSMGGKEDFILDIQEVVVAIMSKLDMVLEMENKGIISKIIRSFKKIS